MSVLGLVTEYNPFHNGHLHHLQRGKEITQATTTIAVMSGQFVQRGEPALIDKWLRTELALKSGVDLVVELPTAFAIQSAELFAYGAISVLNELGVTDLVFGSESNQLADLDRAAELLANEPVDFRDRVQAYLGEGESYPRAITQALNEQLAGVMAPYKANDILGIQYLRVLKLLASPIRAHTISRLHSEYRSTTIDHETIASATAIRNELLMSKSSCQIENLVPEASLQVLNQVLAEGRLNSWDNYYRTIQLLLTSYSPAQLAAIAGMDEGLENRLQAFALQAKTMDELVSLCVSKRYTATKIKRTLLYLLLNFTKDLHAELELDRGPQYLRVLGFNHKGQAYLNSIKSELKLPLITNIPRDRPLMLDFDLKANSIYNIGINRLDAASEFRDKPIIIA